MNVSTGEQLRDLFPLESWQEHLTTLSDILGFTLSIYTFAGDPILIAQSKFPFCTGMLTPSVELQPHCESHCLPFVTKASSSGRPEVFKCYARIVHFVLPIELFEERVVIVGQGSFAAYDDFRDYVSIITAEGLGTESLTAPPMYTSIPHARKICSFVEDSVSRLLRNTRETIVLRKKLESLKSIVGMWGGGTEERPEGHYQDMVNKLTSLIDIDSIMVLVYDAKLGMYASLYSRSRNEEPAEAITIGEQDPLVTELSSGTPVVLSAEPVRDPRAGILNGRGALYFFPITVFRKLEAIVRIEDQALKDGDKQIIIAFCKQTALSLENFHLHQNLFKKFNRFAAIADLTKAITPIRNFDTLVRTILDKSAELLRAEQGSLMLIDGETDELLLQAKKGMLEGVMEKIRINRGEGIAGRVAEAGEAILVSNIESDPRIRQKNREHYKTRSFVSVPLKIDDRIIGVLNLTDKISGDVFDEEDLRLIQSFATQAAVVMERNVFFHKSEELKRLTITDPLTGLLNRRYLYERLKDELARSERYGHELSLLMLDLDGFKYCNDTFGHTFGDKVLKAIAETLLSTVRSMDIVARYGGDEFMVILPETGEPLAVDIAERMRRNLSRPMVSPDGPDDAAPQTLTTSIGITCYPAHGSTIEVLLEHVDKALYRAKNGGKNRIEVYS